MGTETCPSRYSRKRRNDLQRKSVKADVSCLAVTFIQYVWEIQMTCSKWTVGGTSRRVSDHTHHTDPLPLLSEMNVSGSLCHPLIQQNIPLGWHTVFLPKSWLGPLEDSAFISFITCHLLLPLSPLWNLHWHNSQSTVAQLSWRMHGWLTPTLWLTWLRLP